MTHEEKAVENLRNGYNCAQAVACAFHELVGMEERQIFSILEGFGFGMGDSYGVCGAVTGALAVAGMTNSDKDLSHPMTKAGTYALSRAIKAAFLEKNQTLICRELKGLDTKILLRSCEGCVRDAANILEKQVFQEM